MRRSTSPALAVTLLVTLFGLSVFATDQSPTQPDQGEPEVYRQGNGVSPPKLLKETKPSYTAPAMKAKVQGSVLMECVVQTDGTVRDDIKILRSLDTKFGLD